MLYWWVAFVFLVLSFYAATALMVYIVGYKRRLSTGIIALHKRLRVEYGLYQDKGKRPTMEDAHTVVHSLPIWHSDDQDEEDGGTTASLFSIMDGHCGNAASCYAAAHLASKISENWPRCMSTESIVECLYQAHTVMDEQFIDLSRSANVYAGCTCLSTLLVTEPDRVRAFTSNLGDSRAILCKHGAFSSLLNFSNITSSEVATAHAHNLSTMSFSPGSRLVVPLSLDQKPDITPDKERIEASGGHVYPSMLVHGEKVAMRGPCRIFPGGLAVPRAIGDLPYKDLEYLNSMGVSGPLVSSSPVISIYELNDQDEFILQACDGLWDVISSKEAAIFVSSMNYLHQLSRIPHKSFKSLRKPLKQILYDLGVTSYYAPSSVAIAEALCNHAKTRGSMDNITISIIFPDFIRSRFTRVDPRPGGNRHDLLDKVRSKSLTQLLKSNSPLKRAHSTNSWLGSQTTSQTSSQVISSDQSSPQKQTLRDSCASDLSVGSVISKCQGLRGTIRAMDIDALCTTARLAIDVFKSIKTFDALIDVFDSVFVDDTPSTDAYIAESMAYLQKRAAPPGGTGGEPLGLQVWQQQKVDQRNNVVFIDTIKLKEPLVTIQERTLHLWDSYIRKGSTMSTLRNKPQLTGIAEATVDFLNN